MEVISTPGEAEASGYVSPNVNTLYGFGFLDLGPEPVIMSMPNSEGRYYTIETLDYWRNAFAYPAGHEAGYKGGKVAFVGPGWNGELPAGVKRIDCATRWILVQPRVHVTGQADLPGAKKVLNAITTQGLAGTWANPRCQPLSTITRSRRWPPSRRPALWLSTIRCNSGKSCRRA